MRFLSPTEHTPAHVARVDLPEERSKLPPMRRAVALLALWTPSLAAAQPSEASLVVVLSVGGDADEADARLAREAVTAALLAEGLDVMPEADVALRIPPVRIRECSDTRCAHAIGAELGASMVAAVATWTGERGPSSLTVSLIESPSRSHTATVAVDEVGLASAARAALSAARAGQRRTPLVEAAPEPRSTEPAREDTGAEASETTAPSGVDAADSPLQRDRSLEEWVLPSLLGIVGLGLVATSVYALLEEQCDLHGPSGTCLRGDRPNIGLGVLFAVLGGLSVAGGILWLFMGGQPPPMGDIDVVLGPDGGELHVRGRF